MRKLFILVMSLMTLVPSGAQQAAKSGKGELMAYIGTYTQKKAKGIYAYRFQPATGDVKEIGLAAESTSPSFLAVHPNQRFLYAVNEVANFGGKRAGAVSAYAIDQATGKLTLLNQVSSNGAGPCHVALDQKGKWVIVSNYDGGSVAVYPVRADGSLGEASAFVQHAGKVADAKRQGGPHAHYATVSPDNRLVLVADLGLDQIVVYRLDPDKGTLTPNNPPFGKTAPAHGPRHGAFRPDGKFFYAFNEIVPSVTVFRYDGAKGSLDEVQTIPTMEQDFVGNKSGAELMVHPNGKFLYASNRGPNTIAMFSIDPKDGKLTAGARTPTGGKIPRSFGIDPTGAWLFAANQDSDNVVLFEIDQKTGGLTPAGKTLDVGTPVCVVFAAAR